MGTALGAPGQAISGVQGAHPELVGRPGTSRTYAFDPNVWLDVAPRGVTRRLAAAGALRYAGRQIIVSLDPPTPPDFWSDLEVVGAIAAAFERTRPVEGGSPR